MDSQLLNLLIESFDRDLNATEQDQLNKALLVSPELKAEKDKLIAMRSMFSNVSISEDDTFVTRLKERLSLDRQTENSFNAKVVHLFPRVAAACMIIIAALLMSVYVGEGTISMDSLMGVQDITIEDAFYTDYSDFE